MRWWGYFIPRRSIPPNYDWAMHARFDYVRAAFAAAFLGGLVYLLQAPLIVAIATGAIMGALFYFRVFRAATVRMRPAGGRSIRLS
jgi:hypothetical protein